MQAFRTVVSLACLLGVAACASSTPQLDTHFGEAVTAAIAKQTLDPGAGQRTLDASGIDGAAADESLHRYIDTFKAPPPTFVIINSGATAAPAGQ
jgi:hypothetical protein